MTPVRPARLPRPGRGAAPRRRADREPRRTPRRRRPAPSAPCRAATSRRSCSPAGCCATAGCCCSTSPPAASTSAPAPRSTRSSGRSPTAASPSSSSPARSRRCSVSPTGSSSSARARSSTSPPPPSIDEARVLDLVMEGKVPHEPGQRAAVEQAALETSPRAARQPVLAPAAQPASAATSASSSRCCCSASSASITAGDRFASTDNALTILRLAATIGVVSIGMTFVIIGGGIDLSVGAIVALSSVWCTTVATQTMAEDTHWIVMVVVALAVGAGCGLVNGLLIAYGKVVPFIATLAMLASARGLAEIISDRKTQIVKRPGLRRLLQPATILGIAMLGLDLRARRGRRLGPAQPHHLRPPHRRGRRQPRGRPPRRHQRQAAHGLPLRAASASAAASPR